MKRPQSPAVPSWIAALVMTGPVSSCTESGAIAPRADVQVDSEAPPDQTSSAAPWIHGVPLPSTPQEPGDPVRGRSLLLNGSYMSCGFPWSLWQHPLIGPVLAKSFGVEDDPPIAEGREGDNATLPYSVNKFVATDGTEVVNRNCLGCHTGRFDGELVIGLPNVAHDFTELTTDTSALPPAVLDRLGLAPGERAHLDRMMRAADAVGHELQTRTVGQNPAVQLTYALLAHRDPETLAWRDEPTFTQVPARGLDGSIVEDARLTADPAPWWRAHKKTALFYNGMSRGQHRGTMALASSVCVDDLAEARRVDAMFLDMHAYILTLRAPLYRRAIDRELATQGGEVFRDKCAGCHGTYAGDPLDDDGDWYPNLILPLDVIGTDPAMARVAADNVEGTALYNDTFYGQIAPAVPDDPVVGYVAPPLDGIWATAPFFHNGSVPSIELVLDSSRRPTYWRRVDLDDKNFDEDALGWPFVPLDRPQAEAPEAERKYVYDTTLYSQDNGGHTFGDALSQADRRAVIEYLKTL